MTRALPGADPPAARLRCAPGWYPCPWSPGWWRWHSGMAWTERTARRDSPPVTPTLPRHYEVHYRPASHGFHFVMTLVTCGAWLPVWMWSVGGRYRIKSRRF